MNRVMGRVERTRELARRRVRRAKLKKLRKAYKEATDYGKKTEILAKVRKISPFAELGEAKPDE